MKNEHYASLKLSKQLSSNHVRSRSREGHESLIAKYNNISNLQTLIPTQNC